LVTKEVQKKNQISLQDFLSQNKISVFEKGGILEMKTYRNNYSVFIFNEKFYQNQLKLNGIVSQKELKYAKTIIPELERNTNLKIECQNGTDGYYSLIWGTANQPLKSQDIFKLIDSEVEEVGGGILRFINEVERIKELVHKEGREKKKT